MAKPIVIDSKYLPARIPIFPTLTLYLFLDKFQVGGFAAGIVWTLWIIVCLLMVVHFFWAKQVHPKDLPHA